MTNIILVGDIMLSRRVSKVIKNDPAFPFRKIKDTLEGDIVFGNLECPLTDKTRQMEGKKYIFEADPEAIKGLLFAGFNIVSLANNHIIDYREEGITDTTGILKQHNISFVGLDTLTTIKNIGFLAYCKPNSFFKKLKIKPNIIDKKIIEDIRRAKQEVDFLIVSLHWGKEYESKPSEEQRNLARALVDNGANVVVGHHSHVVQEIEKYNRGVIAYSLGNFIFDQMFRQDVRTGCILRIDAGKNKINNFEKIDTYVNDDYEVEIKNLK